MRIQHNIMAMNAYRNYNNNASALSKNLEKLSSGYKINRAGDDAAGLAISEKMRAQITGLNQAKANAKSGINLVQTAEGALQEVHDMLNRMVKLADQSANGTYDDAVDRTNLQKEMAQLKGEIDRIADSANFNGIKLLDGSLNGSIKVSTQPGAAAITGKRPTSGNAAPAVSIGGINVTIGGVVWTKTTGLGDADVASQEKVLAALQAGLTAEGKAGASLDIAFKNDQGLTIEGNSIGAAQTGTIVIKDNGTKIAEITVTLDKNGNTATAQGPTDIAGPTGATAGVAGVAAKGAVTTLDFTGKKGADVLGNTITVGGKTYELVAKGKAGDVGKGNTAIEIDPTAGDTDIANAVQGALNGKVTGADVAADAGTVTLTDTGNPGADSVAPEVKIGGGLTLQIGDTAETFNQLTVSVGDMHTKSLGIDGVDISTQLGAKAADKILKDAINMVSSTRGDLGAMQNRLDHTINNISVMTENIQDAESTIRDTDVAEEMMAYTKNNILLQSAQAMLAQANQVPQGVLQLLQ